MAFNATTYRMNKFRKQAWAYLQAARDIRARVTADPAHEWERPRIATHVQLARGSMRMHLIERRIRAIDRRP